MRQFTKKEIGDVTDRNVTTELAITVNTAEDSKDVNWRGGPQMPIQGERSMEERRTEACPPHQLTQLMPTKVERSVEERISAEAERTASKQTHNWTGGPQLPIQEERSMEERFGGPPGQLVLNPAAAEAEKTAVKQTMGPGNRNEDDDLAKNENEMNNGMTEDMNVGTNMDVLKTRAVKNDATGESKTEEPENELFKVSSLEEIMMKELSADAREKPGTDDDMRLDLTDMMNTSESNEESCNDVCNGPDEAVMGMADERTIRPSGHLERGVNTETDKLEDRCDKDPRDSSLLDEGNGK
jgi:hypothetical protein